MSQTTSISEEQPLVLNFGSVLGKMSDHEFYTFCRSNPELRLERTSKGDLVITAPTGGLTGTRNFTLNVLFGQWVEANGTGLGSDSSAGFSLPNGAQRSPDLAWVARSRWDALSLQEQEEFPPICPDFVVELRSRTDELATVPAKMEEYVENGAQLGWLIDPQEKKVYIYSPHAEVTCLENPLTVSGEPCLSGFSLNVQRLWN